jgi:hypothetical protein
MSFIVHCQLVVSRCRTVLWENAKKYAVFGSLSPLKSNPCQFLFFYNIQELKMCLTDLEHTDLFLSLPYLHHHQSPLLGHRPSLWLTHKLLMFTVSYHLDFHLFVRFLIFFLLLGMRELRLPPGFPADALPRRRHRLRHGHTPHL